MPFCFQLSISVVSYLTSCNTLGKRVHSLIYCSAPLDCENLLYHPFVCRIHCASSH